MTEVSEILFWSRRCYRQLRGQMSWSGNKGLEDTSFRRLVRGMPRQGLQSFCAGRDGNFSTPRAKKMANSEELAIC